MKGDFTRDTFNPQKHFLRVLMQQGRVQLDADWNEQAAILLHYLQSLAADIFGPYGGPGDGFKIAPQAGVQRDFFIQPGHYYVDGILCENDAEAPVPYTGQPDYPLTDPEKLQNNKNYLVYLDVWERHITYVEDFRFPSIREIALDGPDTATRTKIVWQVKIEETTVTSCSDIDWDQQKENWQPNNRGRIKAKGKEPSKRDVNPCNISPEARFRGPENQLYRVEIHTGGAAGTAKFKWSRDNGSVIFPIRKLQSSTVVTVTLEHLGPDGRRSLQVGDWVEIIDDDIVLKGKAGSFLQVELFDEMEKTVTLTMPPGVTLTTVYNEDDPRHPLLRRWDNDDLMTVHEGTTDNDWIDLEDGIRIQFQPAPQAMPAPPPHLYRTGDYWLIPARTAVGDVLWPTEKDGEGKKQPLALPPHGVEHHFAPLAVVSVNTTGTVEVNACRTTMEQSAREHVVLELIGGVTGGCGPDLYDFVRVLPDGNSESGAGGLGYRVPPGKVLVVTDVDWQCVHPDGVSAAGTIQTLSLSIENLADPSISTRAFESTITLSSQGEGGTSESMTSGFVVSSEAKICPDGVNRLQHLILRGYLAPAN